MSELHYVNLTEKLAPQCAALETACFPHADPDELLSEEAVRAYCPTHSLCRTLDRVVAADVEEDRRHAISALSLERSPVFRVSDGGQHRHAGRRQSKCGGPTDSTRGPCNKNVFSDHRSKPSRE